HSVAFPFNIRLAMLGWKRLFFTPQRFEPEAGRSDIFNRGKYLAEGPAHCGACHTPRNIFGARDHSQPYAGSDSGTPAGQVPAITPDALLTAGYDRAWVIEVLQGGVTPEFDVPGGAMFEVVSEGTSHWTDDDLNAIAAYLLNED
ncbi:cytochrome c, partial [bacterium]|nr:cytochrome c [bacterium]